METQTIAQPEETCPKDIVQQLLDIAKSHDALDEIGGATSWRWQEGIISRMPKIKSVAKILKKAYGSDCPSDWIRKTNGPLQIYLKRSFKYNDHQWVDFSPKNIFEAAIFLTLVDGRGFEYKEMVIRLCFLKYYDSLKSEDDFNDVDEASVFNLYEKWSCKILTEFLKEYNIKKNESGLYVIEGNVEYVDPKLIEYQNRIFTLRNKEVEYNSNFDMWRMYSISLSDKEMIEIEKRMLAHYFDLVKEIKSKTNVETRDQDNLRTRFFSMSAISLRSNFEEDLKWKN